MAAGPLGACLIIGVAFRVWRARAERAGLLHPTGSTIEQTEMQVPIVVSHSLPRAFSFA